MKMKRGALIVCARFQLLYWCRGFNGMYRPAVNQRMGRSQLGCDAGTHERAYKAHRRAYQKPTSSSSDTELYIRPFHTPTIPGQRGHASIAHLTRVRSPALALWGI